MKKLIIAAGIALAASSSAFAQSTALDVVTFEPVNRDALIDFAATASIGNEMTTQHRARLGDGSPQYMNENVRIDFTPTASIGNAGDVFEHRARLGDGSPVYR
jgi:hypothetical protein